MIGDNNPADPIHGGGERGRTAIADVLVQRTPAWWRTTAGRWSLALATPALAAGISLGYLGTLSPTLEYTWGQLPRSSVSAPAATPTPSTPWPTDVVPTPRTPEPPVAAPQSTQEATVPTTPADDTSSTPEPVEAVSPPAVATVADPPATEVAPTTDTTPTTSSTDQAAADQLARYRTQCEGSGGTFDPSGAAGRGVCTYPEQTAAPTPVGGAG